MSFDHLEQCRRVADEFRRVLALPHPTDGNFLARFLKLSAVLLNQNSGTKGAGLTGGVQQENLWFEMIETGSTSTGGPVFARKPPSGKATTRDYDYHFGEYPLSHKTIGWSGSGDLALAWSKNPPGGVQRTEFESSMVIVCSRKPARRGKWKAVATGIYVIPLPVLTAHVTFKSNNKSDSIIGSNDAIRCMMEATRLGLFTPFTFDPELGRYRTISVWHAGPDAIRERKN